MIEQIKRIYRTKIRPHCIGSYETFNDAKEYIKYGYEDIELINSVVAKTKVYQNNLDNNFSFADLRFFVPLLLSKGRDISIVDIGGAAGYAYFTVNKLWSRISNDVNLKWTIVETKTMANRAYKVFPDLSFIDINQFMETTKTRSESTSVEVLMASSTIQYMESPDDFLSKIVALKKFGYIWITRTPFLEEGNKFSSIQQSKLSSNGISTNMNEKDKKIDYVITFISLDVVTKIFENNGYEVIALIKEDTYITAKHICISYYSILAKKANKRN